MTELDNQGLLAEFAHSESESAFAMLVARNVDLVYSTALRFTGQPHYAEEITQAVFIILARKAKSLSRKTVVSGWLYQTARLTAANFLKGEIRRQQRELEAYMQTNLDEPDEAAWASIAPLLEEAMGRLGETDRAALVLRFFENKSAGEIAAALHMKEDAAQKRVTRALEKLRAIFTKKGVTLAATVIAGAVSANSVQAAPAGLAATISATAAKGLAVGATINSLVNGTLKFMTYVKIKLALGITAGIILAGGATTMVISQTTSDDKWTPQEIIKKAQEKYAALSSYSDTGKTVTERGKQTETITFGIRLQRSNLYRIEWSQANISGLFNKIKITSNSGKGLLWSAGNGNFFTVDPDGQKMSFQNLQQALRYTQWVSGEATTTIPGLFFKIDWPPGYGGIALNQTNASMQRLKDERINGVDCYVVSIRHAGTTTIWIGKGDSLIHQTRKNVEEVSAPRSDSEIRAILQSQNQPATPEAIATVKKVMAQTQRMKAITTQTHENIVVNQKFSPADFAN